MDYPSDTMRKIMQLLEADDFDMTGGDQEDASSADTNDQKPDPANDQKKKQDIVKFARAMNPTNPNKFAEALFKLHKNEKPGPDEMMEIIKSVILLYKAVEAKPELLTTLKSAINNLRD